MFSGFSNQVTSWIGAAKGEPVDEEVPAPPAQAAAVSGEALESEGYVAQAQSFEGESVAPAEGEDGEKKQRYFFFQ